MSWPPPPITDPMIRFMRKVEKTDTCWLWTAALTPKGYGQFLAEKRNQRPSHVWYWEQCNGPVPEGLQLDHLCRVRRCVNPDHLEPVTPQVNTLRGNGLAAQNARKTHCVNGHPFDADNTYVRPGRRRCRVCMAAYARKVRARNKEHS